MELEKKDILEFGDIVVTAEYTDDKFYLNWGELSAELEPFSNYMVILRWSGENRTVDMKVYPYTYRQDLPQYLLRPEMYWWDFENPTFSGVGDFSTQFNKDFWVSSDRTSYNDDWTIEGPCQIHPWPLSMTNIKYYRGWMSDEEMIKESIKYTTNNDQCVINDLARPILSGYGYSIK